MWGVLAACSVKRGSGLQHQVRAVSCLPSPWQGGPGPPSGFETAVVQQVGLGKGLSVRPCFSCSCSISYTRNSEEPFFSRTHVKDSTLSILLPWFVL